MKRALLLVLALLGCAWRPSLPYRLQPASTGPRCFANQEVVFRRPGAQPERLLTTVENDGRRLSIVASSPLGQTLFVLRVEDGPAVLDARVPLPEAFDPNLLPALIQLSDWPLEEARKGLAPGMELREEGALRTLLRKGRTLLTLDRKGAEPPYRAILLRVPPMDLEATITTLDD
ncbi:DUF3261 domain-containing protein [Mesoterricola silvestris]|uniref:DUF3261 domain-containing protein n=1 Tax=Mesoterricola silvestris TaxID=2927979 RepID=A0AA48GP70_9BACT|nr:DUF3261 domain-containing protein [Mesoterricola silvestris]BDU71447.1 hypothetical protein METEAL_06210 [Mesoterricola silvestris]